MEYWSAIVARFEYIASSEQKGTIKSVCCAVNGAMSSIHIEANSSKELLDFTGNMPAQSFVTTEVHAVADTSEHLAIVRKALENAKSAK